jgi:PhnB protein
MNAIVNYLNFDGDCKAAIEFYAKCLGGELTVMPFGDLPPEACGGADISAARDRVMHARIVQNGTPVLMASDIMPGMPYQQGNNFSVCIGCSSMEEIKSAFAALSENGSVTMPLCDQFWGAHFGMLKDQFGVHWMLSYEYPKQ